MVIPFARRAAVRLHVESDHRAAADAAAASAFSNLRSCLRIVWRLTQAPWRHELPPLSRRAAVPLHLNGAALFCFRAAASNFQFDGAAPRPRPRPFHTVGFPYLCSFLAFGRLLGGRSLHRLHAA